MFLFRLLWFTVVVTCLQTNAHVDKRNHRHGSMKRQSDTETSYTGPIVPSFNISVPIDHFNSSDARVYNNRYWVNDTYYQPGGPVFFVDLAGAGVTEKDAASYLADFNGTSSAMVLARQYNGLAILWEHRYYGLSLPFPFTNNGSTNIDEPIGAPETWAYLTVDQALEDVVYFANNFSTGGYQRDDIDALSPSSTPWIWIGGSYSGQRGAWSRVRSPDTIYASWSSSAAVQAVYDGSIYYNEVLRSLPSNCSTDTRAIISYVDEVLSGDSASPEYIEIQRYAYIASVVGFNSVFAGTGARSIDSYNISDAADVDPFQVGNTFRVGVTDYAAGYGPSLAQDIFCNYLESFNPGVPGTNATDEYISVATNPGDAAPSDEGFLATHNNNLTLGLQAFAYACAQFQNYGFEFSGSLAEPDLPPHLLGDLASWQWQSNTQYGWFLGSNPDNITIVSRYINFTSVQRYVDSITFSDATLAVLPSEPDVQSINKYGGWDINPSNTMFTDGEFDPFRAGSVFSRESDAPGNQPSSEVPQCGVAPSDGTRYGIVYEGAAHSWDLTELETVYRFAEVDGQSPQERGLELFMAALDVWLPCFNGRSGGTGSGSGSNTTAPDTFTGGAETASRAMWTWSVLGLMTAVLATVMLI